MAFEQDLLAGGDRLVDVLATREIVALAALVSTAESGSKETVASRVTSTTSLSRRSMEESSVRTRISSSTAVSAAAIAAGSGSGVGPFIETPSLPF